MTIVRTVRARNRTEAARKAQRALDSKRVRFLCQTDSRHFTYSVKIGS